MPNISGNLYDLTRFVLQTNSVITAYLASEQHSVLTLTDGTAVPPVGTPQASTVSNNLGAYVLDNLSLGVLYHLYVEPENNPAYWVTNRTADPEPEVSPCVLTGSLVDPTADFVYAFLETPAVVAGGLHINQGTVYSGLSLTGSFSLPLWPTDSLTPRSLYRVILGHTVYRGLVPTQDQISLDDWIALITTLQVS